LLFLFLSLIYSNNKLPFKCVIRSEVYKEILIELNERSYNSLNGKLLEKNNVIGLFNTGKSDNSNNPWWSIQVNNKKGYGRIKLFKDNEIWNPYKTQPIPSETNRLIFINLEAFLKNLEKNKSEDIYISSNLLTAASDFWKINDKCLGGRIKKI
tara:strand:+ start:2196 stop:2657 length:462 start_codon:yes stop_codon:yes gene_type:complete